MVLKATAQGVSRGWPLTLVDSHGKPPDFDTDSRVQGSGPRSTPVATSPKPEPDMNRPNTRPPRMGGRPGNLQNDVLLN